MSPSSVAQPRPDGQRIRCADPTPRMAKAELGVRTVRDERATYGRILKRASDIAGLNRDQTADVTGADPSQISRWWSGDENAQVWRYHRNPVLRRALRLAEAEADERCIVEHVIREKVG